MANNPLSGTRIPILHLLHHGRPNSIGSIPESLSPLPSSSSFFSSPADQSAFYPLECLFFALPVHFTTDNGDADKDEDGGTGRVLKRRP